MPTFVLGIALVLGVAAAGAALRPAEVTRSLAPPDETVVRDAVLSVEPTGPSGPVSLADAVRQACRGLVDADAAVLRARATAGEERAGSLVVARAHVRRLQDGLRWDEDVSGALDAYVEALEDGDLDALGPVRDEAYEACRQAEADPG